MISNTNSQINLASDVKMLWKKALAKEDIAFKDIYPAFSTLMQRPEYFAVTIPDDEEFHPSLARRLVDDNYIISILNAEESFGIMANVLGISLCKSSIDSETFELKQIPVCDIGKRLYSGANWKLDRDKRYEPIRYEGVTTFIMNKHDDNPWNTRKALVIEIDNDPILSELLRGQFEPLYKYLLDFEM